jgi:hypothetical protein
MIRNALGTLGALLIAWLAITAFIGVEATPRNWSRFTAGG